MRIPAVLAGCLALLGFRAAWAQEDVAPTVSDTGEITPELLFERTEFVLNAGIRYLETLAADREIRKIHEVISKLTEGREAYEPALRYWAGVKELAGRIYIRREGVLTTQPGTRVHEAKEERWAWLSPCFHSIFNKSIPNNRFIATIEKPWTKKGDVRKRFVENMRNRVNLRKQAVNDGGATVGEFCGAAPDLIRAYRAYRRDHFAEDPLTGEDCSDTRLLAIWQREDADGHPFLAQFDPDDRAFFMNYHCICTLPYEVETAVIEPALKAWRKRGSLETMTIEDAEPLLAELEAADAE